MNKIRLELHDKNDLRKPDYMVINLDSEKVYTVSPSAGTFRVSPLQNVRPANAEVIAEIAGQKTTTVLPTAQGTNFLGGILPSATLYVAENLFFPVNENLAGNQFLSIVQKARIVLGVKVDLASQYPAGNKDNSENNQSYMSVMADSVRAQPLSDSLFIVPSGFHKSTYDSVPNLTNGDSTSMDSDTNTVRQTTLPKKKSKKLPVKGKPTIKYSPLGR